MVSTEVSKTFSLGSNPSIPTMIIAVYKLNGKILKTTNLEKKLKKVTPDEILYQLEFDGDLREAEKILDNWLSRDRIIDNNVETKLFHFKNKKTGYTITSIYDNLDNLKDLPDINDYEKCEG